MYDRDGVGHTNFFTRLRRRTPYLVVSHSRFDLWSFLRGEIVVVNGTGCPIKIEAWAEPQTFPWMTGYIPAGMGSRSRLRLVLDGKKKSAVLRVWSPLGAAEFFETPVRRGRAYTFSSAFSSCRDAEMPPCIADPA